MTHTLGEWKREGLSVVVDQHGIICRCPVVAGGGVFEVDANTYLIAAAPDLLEALKECCQYHDLPLKEKRFHVLNPGKGNMVRWVDCELSEKARQAIAQAEGDTPSTSEGSKP